MTRNLTLFSLVLALFCVATTLHAEPIHVKHSQGTVRGFLLVRSEAGEILGHGDLIQTAHGSRVTTELALHFKDGSLDDETTTYTQNGVFHLLTDHHIQKGPFFSKPIDYLIEANGQITSRSIDKDGKEKVETQHLNLPPDLSNGMIGPLLANIPPTTPQFTLGMVAPAGKGRLVKLSIFPDAPTKFTDVGLTYTATVFRIHIELGGVAGVVAPIIGKQPGDLFVWIIEGPAPQFVRMVGALADGGPIVSIELSGATFPHSDATPR
jgi:hypothetical protein